jgi:glucose/arabinose dehydrogenase
MSHTPRSRIGLAAAGLAVLAAVIAVPGALAHPPSAPYDNTIFAPIQPGGPVVRLTTVATGLTAPNKALPAPGEPGRLYVVDQPGTIWRLELATGKKSVFGNVSSFLVPLGFLGPGTFDERGLLGLAFHPGYPLVGKVYTYTSEPKTAPATLPSTIATPDHQNVVAEWPVKNAGSAKAKVDTANRRVLIREDHPQFNHDGGDLAFGPDGMLYISDGDGGGADDEGPGHVAGGNGQSLANALGKIWRIDVNGSNSANGQYGIPADNPFVGTPGAVKEIYAFGFRNPFRFSFDGATLLVGDVGQNDIEEVDVVVKGGNYGWAAKEGTLFFYGNGADVGTASTVDNGLTSPAMIDPIAQYDTHHEGHSVIGGYVYRGAGVPDLRGRYVFGDFSRLFRFPSGPNDLGRLFVLAQKNETTGLRNIQELHYPDGTGFGDGDDFESFGIGVLGIGRDARDELYVLGNVSGTPFGTEGKILRIDAVSS